ncbi:unnamed protein product [Paramecium sonneborni]|uniref:Ubiquitin-like protease family profile domain-containing protein n=1 Tax=Paramecium sonneborni TaxID=65129 RepID=A0A8S1KEP3_9CILI|nr:unnamed protein product [Paramecium sonneborni]
MQLEEDSEKMNFIDYVKWAFIENEKSRKQVEDDENLAISSSSFKLLDGDEMGKIHWMFRRCQSQTKLKEQGNFYTQNYFILNHIFYFLLTIINDGKSTYEQILRLMKSIGINYEEEMLQLVHIEDDELLKLKYEKQKVQKKENINQQDFRTLLKIILEIKEISIEQSNEIIDLRNIFDLKTNLELASIFEQLPFIMLQINAFQGKEFKEKEAKLKKEKENEKEKEKLKKQQQQQQHEYQFKQVQLIQQEKIKFGKVLHRLKHKEQQNQILLFDGTIVTGKFWISHHEPSYIPLPINFNMNAFYCNARISHYNEEIKQKINSSLLYQGSVNDQFDPHVNKLQYQEEIDGILKFLDDNDVFQYKGCFQDGLFDGIGRMYRHGYLQYIGEFKGGVRHGLGKELFAQDGTYLCGKFENDKKDGIFTLEKCIDYSTRDKKWLKYNQGQKLFQNGKELILKREPQQLLLRRLQSTAPVRTILNYGESGITNYQLKSLQAGKWLNSNIIDIVIQSVLTQRFLISPNLKNNNTIFINCAKFQDIFGSLISKDQPIENQVFKDIIDNHNNNQKQLRFVFFFNLDRGHFLSVVYENEKLYLIDSLKDKKADLLHQIKKLLKDFNFNVIDGWQDIPVSQQKNSYDCGIYTINYICQIIKNIELSIPEMIKKNCFIIEQIKINMIRYLIGTYFLQLGIELLQL